jgi:hypothetical protein
MVLNFLVLKTVWPHSDESAWARNIENRVQNRIYRERFLFGSEFLGTKFTEVNTEIEPNLPEM